ncbi:unnamed protein product [Closterium sp. NIES-53]
MATITVVAVARGGQQQLLPHTDTLSPQQLREWVLQGAHPGGGGFGFLHTAQRRQRSASESAAAPGASESAVALGASEFPATPGASESAAALGARSSTATGPASAEALHTFTLDSGTSRCFFRDYTTLTPLAAPVPVSLADPTGGPVAARASTIFPCPAVPSSSLPGLHLPMFSTKLVSNAAIQDVWVDNFIPGGQRVAICQVAASSQVSVSGQLAASCSCQERYVLLTVDDYTRYTTVFPLRRKADVSGVLIPWIHATRRQPRERFCRDLRVPRPHSNRGGEFSSGLLEEFCDPLPPQGPTPSGVSQTEGEGSGGAAPRVAATGGASSGDAATGGADFGGAASPSGGGPVGDPAGGPGAGQPPQPDLLETLSPQAIRVWIVRRGSPGGGGYGPAGAGAANPRDTIGAGGTVGGARGAASAGGTRGAAGAGGTGAASPGGATGAGGAGPTSLGGAGATSTRGAGAASAAGAAGHGGAPTRGTGAAGAGGAARAGGTTGVAGTGGAGAAGTGGTGAVGTGGAEAAGPGGACTRGAGAVGADGAAGAGGAGGATGAAGIGGARGTTGAGGGGAGAAGAGGAAGAEGAGGATGAAGTGGAGGTTGARGAGAAGARGAAGAGGAGAAGAGGAGAAGIAHRRLFFHPQRQSSLPPSDLVLRQPAPAPHTEVSESLTERREPETRASTPVRARRVARPCPPPVPGNLGMALRPSYVPQRVVLPEPPASSLLHIPDPESDLARAASPTVTRLLAIVITYPDFESTAAFSLGTELVDLAARSCLDYVTSLVTGSESVSPPSVGGEPPLTSDVLEDRQSELECLAAALPRFASMLLCPEGDPDAL